MLKDTATMSVFNCLAKISVGDGSKVLFWTDRWIEGYSAQEIAPLVVASMATRVRNSRKVVDALQHEDWIRDIDANISMEGWLQCIMLWEALDGTQLDPSRPDCFRWSGSASGQYSAKATYNSLCQGRILVPLHSPI
jgi:hypothetical protein